MRTIDACVLDFKTNVNRYVIPKLTTSGSKVPLWGAIPRTCAVEQVEDASSV